MTITEILKDITVEDEFFERLHCQNELLAGMSNDKVNNYILACMSQGDDIYKVACTYIYLAIVYFKNERFNTRFYV